MQDKLKDMIRLELHRFGVAQRIPDELIANNVDVQVFRDVVRGACDIVIKVSALERTLEGNRETTTHYPDGPLERWKEKWLPSTLRRFWPVRYVRVPVSWKFFRICPHIPLSHSGTHIHWLAQDEEDKEVKQ